MSALDPARGGGVVSGPLVSHGVEAVPTISEGDHSVTHDLIVQDVAKLIELLT
jgi:hypothetical protein